MKDKASRKGFDASATTGPANSGSNVEKTLEVASPPSTLRKANEPPATTTQNKQHPPSQHNDPPPPPEGGYGWVCVACTFFINCHTWGINSSYGIFLAYYLSHNYYPGATSLEFAMIGGLSISQALLVSPLATYITRVYGTRYTLLVGVVLETAALVGASFTHATWQLFLSQGLCFGYGMGFLFVGSVGIVPQWFVRRRSLANGIGTAGSGVGGMMYSLATNAMIQHLGVEWAFRILGILCFVVNTTCALLMRDRMKAIGARQAAFDYRLLKVGGYWLLLGWGFFSMMGYIVLLFSLPNYAVSIGLTSQQGSIVGALLNLGQAIGRPLVGIFSDSAGRINLAGIATFLAGLFSLVIWIFAKSFGVLIFFAIVVGTVSGTFWTTIGPVGAEVVGLKELPSALCIVWIFLVLPTTFSEPIALELRQTTGNIYLHAQIYAGFMYIAAALCMWLLRAWKLGEVERQAALKAAALKEREDQPSRRSSSDDTDVPAGATSEPLPPSRSGQPSSFARRLVAWKVV